MTFPSGDDLVNDSCRQHACESEIESLGAECEAFVAESQLVQDGGMNVTDVDGVFDGAEAKVVGFAESCAFSEATASKPHGEGIDMMIAAGGFTNFAHGCPSEFTAPNDDCVFQQSSLLQVANECRAGLVDIPGFFGEMFFEVFGRAAVVIPVGVVKLYEPDTSFDESACEKAVSGETGFPGVSNSVHIEGHLSFTGRVHKFGGAGLHSEGHFGGVDACGDFRIPGGVESLAIECGDGIDDLSLLIGRNAGWCGQVDDWIALIS